MDFTSEIGVIGAGAMGSGIAQVALQAGHKVILTDTQETALQQGRQNIEKGLAKLVEKGKMSEANRDSTLSRLKTSTDYAELASCVLIIEAIVENLAIKTKVFADLETIVKPEAIIATNTSSLSVTKLSAALKNPERFIGIHFFNPAPIMALVEIIPALQTNQKTTDFAFKLITKWGKKTVKAKDTPGFIVNRVARPYYTEALRIYEEGIADPTTIDYAMRSLGGFKMGPFELMDFIGHDVNYLVTHSVWEGNFYEPRYQPSHAQRLLYEAGHFGRKSGRGFYDYSPDATKIEPNLNPDLLEIIFSRIICMLINEAAEAVHFDICSPTDVDTAMTSGVNYPKGLLQWGAELGINNVVAQLDSLYNDYHDPRYRCSSFLRRYALSN
jgi:3-hydroxybutyryl-CoA dehydrogenase